MFLLSMFTLEATGILNFSNQNSNNLNPEIDSSSQPEVDYNSPTDEQIDSGEYIKGQNNQNNNTGSFVVSISSAIIDNGVIKIRSVINGIISSNGTCSLKMTNGSKQYSASASTFAMTSYSTCQGFNINQSDLASGDWQITLEVTAESKTSTANSSIALD